MPAHSVQIVKNNEEYLSSQVDGITDIFTLSDNAISNTIEAYINGIKIKKGTSEDFVELSATSLQIKGDILQLGESLVVEYKK